ncbi:unnamed protein product, partial [Rotaria socialis]
FKLTLSDDGSGKGAALIAIVADRFQKNQMKTLVSFDENDEEEEEARSHPQSRPSKPITFNTQSVPSTFNRATVS